MAYTQYIVLFRGDDTDFAGNQEIKIKLETEMSLEGVSAHFKFLDFEQDFDTIPEDKELRLVFSANVTKQFPIGSMDAELYLVDERRKRRTIANRIHIVVTQSVAEAYDNTDPQAITVSILGVSSSVSWNNIIDKPNEFPPSAHTHETNDITGLDKKLEDIEKKFDNIKIDVDKTIIQGSENPVSGGAVYNGLAGKQDKLQNGFGTDVVVNTYTSKIVKDGETIVVDWNGGDSYHTLYFPLIDIDYHNENSANLKPFAYRMRFRYIPFATGVEATKELSFIFPQCLISVVGDGGFGIDYRIDNVVVYVNDTPLEFDISLYKSPSLPDYLPQVVMRITKLDGSPSVADELKAQINAANAILEEVV